MSKLISTNRMLFMWIGHFTMAGKFEKVYEYLSERVPGLISLEDIVSRGYVHNPPNLGELGLPVITNKVILDLSPASMYEAIQEFIISKIATPEDLFGDQFDDVDQKQLTTGLVNLFAANLCE